MIMVGAIVPSFAGTLVRCWARFSERPGTASIIVPIRQSSTEKSSMLGTYELSRSRTCTSSSVTVAPWITNPSPLLASTIGLEVPRLALILEGIFGARKRDFIAFSKFFLASGPPRHSGFMARLFCHAAIKH